MAGEIYQSLTAINTEVGKEAGYKIPCSSFSSCLWGLRLFPRCPLTVVQYYRYVTSWRCLCFVAQAMMCAYSPPMVPSFPPRNLSLWYYTFNVCFDCQLADKLFLPYQQVGIFVLLGLWEWTIWWLWERVLENPTVSAWMQDGPLAVKVLIAWQLGNQIKHGLLSTCGRDTWSTGIYRKVFFYIVSWKSGNNWHWDYENWSIERKGRLKSLSRSHSSSYSYIYRRHEPR